MSFQIKYQKGDLIKKAPKEDYILHSCNARGVWGKGFAKQLKDKYPKSFNEYKAACSRYEREQESPVGECLITSEKIICIFTSHDYGDKVDSPEQILLATESALSSLILSKKDIRIHSPKINSGLFQVPWDQTAQIIEEALSLFPKKNIMWTVWDLE